jgi:hypothetical protein
VRSQSSPREGLYTTLGFERAKTAPPEGGKHVILLRKKDDAFLSVYDSDNAAFC